MFPNVSKKIKVASRRGLPPGRILESVPQPETGVLRQPQPCGPATVPAALFFRERTMAGPILELRNISKRYPHHLAVDNVSLAVESGAFFSLLGPSGCGKTTLLRMIGGFEAPSSGDLWLAGERVNHLQPYQRNVTTVFQSYALFPHLSVEDNVAFGLRRRRDPESVSKVREALAMVQLTGKESRLPAQLSGGEKQRVAVARALAVKPDVLLLDEPLAALDPKLRRQMRGELKELQRRIGITFLFVTHDQEEALSLSDQIAVMNGGRLEQIASPQEIYGKPASRFVAGFMGTVNWIGNVGIRPEATRIAAHPPGNGAHARPGQVVGADFLGNCFHVRARLDSGEFAIAEIPCHQAGFQAGDAVHVWWRESDEMNLPA